MAVLCDPPLNYTKYLFCIITVFSFPGSGRAPLGGAAVLFLAGLVLQRAVVIQSCMTGVRFCRCALSGAAFGFLAACVDWMVLCSGLLWCTVLRDWARKKIRFQRFLVFPWYRRSFRRRWMAGSELSLICDQAQLGKSPARCCTGKSDGGLPLGPFFYFPAPPGLWLRRAKPSLACPALLGWPGSFRTSCRAGKSNKISNRTKLRTGQVEASKASRMLRAPMTSTPSHLEAERFFRPW